MNQPIEDAACVRELTNDAVSLAISKTFSTMFGLKTEISRDYITESYTGLGRTVAGVIGWVGLWSGTGIFECSPECACMIANLMLGTAIDILNEDALDAVAEMANIIFGGMKTELESTFGSMGLSTPTVIYGNEVGMRSSGEEFTRLTVQISKYSIYVKLYMTRSGEKRSNLNHFWAASCAGAA